jgi:hypothetical protein
MQYVIKHNAVKTCCLIEHYVMKVYGGVEILQAMSAVYRTNSVLGYFDVNCVRHCKTLHYPHLQVLRGVSK